MSFTNVDLPEPDTPVTETKQPSGISTSIFFKLCSLAPLMVTQSPLGVLRSCGVEINRFPEMYWPVMDSLFSSIAKLSRSGQSLPHVRLRRALYRQCDQRHRLFLHRAQQLGRYCQYL